jgi:hypothetical protein
VINRRFQGVAEEICKTHQIVLTKLIKLGVRSTKALGLDLVVKDLKIPGGYLEELQDT